VIRIGQRYRLRPSKNVPGDEPANPSERLKMNQKIVARRGALPAVFDKPITIENK
jgi:hypothetical protein